MTKKHFKALAEELRRVKPTGDSINENRMWRLCVDAVASVCQSSNKRFNRDRFMRVCEREDDRR